MKTPALFLSALLGIGLNFASAEEATPLPFSVTIGGQVATHREEEPFAKVAKPVAKDAAISIEVQSEMVIINVAPVDAQGKPVPGVAPAVILLQGTTKGSLADTLDKHALLTGDYLMSITAQSKTASVLVSIK